MTVDVITDVVIDRPVDQVSEYAADPLPTAREPTNTHLTIHRSVPRSISFQPDRHRAQIKCSPPPTALTPIEPRRPPPAPATPTPGPLPRPHRRHHHPGALIEDHRLDDRARQPQHPLPYPRVPHPVLPFAPKPLDSPET